MRAALVLAVIVAAAPAGATPAQDYDRALDAFRAHQYQSALPLFNVLLYPPPAKIAGDQLTDAYVWLGVCRLETGDDDGAKREFEKALALDPTHQLDPLVIANKDALRLFDDTKTEIKTRADREAVRRQRADELERQRKFLKSLVVYRSHNLYLNFVPFGTGQFQNGQTAKGLVFAASEGAMLVTSVSIWGYLVNKYGIRSTHVALADGANVRVLQQVEIGGGLVFLGLWIFGAIDAYRHYTPQTRVDADRSYLPAELRNVDPGESKPKKKPKKPAKTSILDHLSPIVTPSGAGIGLAWEN